MMNYNYMIGNSGIVIFFVGIIFILVAVLLALGVVALLKHINKK